MRRTPSAPTIRISKSPGCRRPRHGEVGRERAGGRASAFSPWTRWAASRWSGGSRRFGGMERPASVEARSNTPTSPGPPGPDARAGPVCWTNQGYTLFRNTSLGHASTCRRGRASFIEGPGPAALRKGRAAQEKPLVLAVLANDRRAPAARTLSLVSRRLGVGRQGGRLRPVFCTGHAHVRIRQRFQARQGNGAAACTAQGNPGRIDQRSPGRVPDADFPAAAARATQPSVKLSDGIHRERSIEPGFQHCCVDGRLPVAPGTLHQNTLKRFHARHPGRGPRRLQSHGPGRVRPISDSCKASG